MVTCKPKQACAETVPKTQEAQPQVATTLTHSQKKKQQKVARQKQEQKEREIKEKEEQERKAREKEEKKQLYEQRKKERDEKEQREKEQQEAEKNHEQQAKTIVPIKMANPSKIKTQIALLKTQIKIVQKMCQTAADNPHQTALLIELQESILEGLDLLMADLYELYHGMSMDLDIHILLLQETNIHFQGDRPPIVNPGFQTFFTPLINGARGHVTLVHRLIPARQLDLSVLWLKDYL